MIHAVSPISSAVPASFPLQGPGAFVSCFYKYNRHFSSPEAIEKCLFFCEPERAHACGSAPRCARAGCACTGV